MRCRACRARLTYDDNYCRKCGAAVEVYDTYAVNAAQTTPGQQVASLRQAALPVVARGTAMLLAGTLLRLAVRMLLSRQQAPGRSLLQLGRREPLVEGEVEEILYVRRTRLH